MLVAALACATTACERATADRVIDTAHHVLAAAVMIWSTIATARGVLRCHTWTRKRRRKWWRRAGRAIHGMRVAVRRAGRATMRHVTTVAVHGMIIGTAMMNAPDVLHACAKVYKWVNSHDNGQKRWVPTVLMICVIGTTCRAAEGAAQMTAAMACAHGCVRATQRLRTRCRAVTARWRAGHDARVRRQERAAAHAAARATVWARVGMRRPVTLPFTKRQTPRSRIHKRAVIMFIAVTITVATAARLNAEIAGVMHAIVLLRAGDVEPHPGPTAGAPATPAKAPDRTVIGKRAQPRAARGKGGLMRVGTLNAPGIHVRRTDRTGSERDEGWGDGWDLKTTATPKLAAVRDAMQQRLITVMSLTETRLRAEELSAVGGFFQRVGYQHAGLPGSETVS